MRHTAAPLKGASKAPPPPPPPPGREVRDGAPPLVVEIFAITLLFAGLAWAKPDLVDWLRSWSAPVHTSARIACAPPSEHETRLVYLNASADGSLVLACGPMVGGSGAYPGARP